MENDKLLYNQYYDQPQKDIYFFQFVQEIKRHQLLWRDNMTIVIILKGEVEITVHGDVTVMKEDDVFLINPNYEYSTMARSKNCLAAVVIFDPVIFRRSIENFDALLFSCRTDEKTRYEDRFNRVRGLMAYLMKHGITQANMLDIEGAYYLFASMLLRDFPPEYFNMGMGEQRLYTFDNILEYIRGNYKSNISLQDVAKVGNYNPAYISHLFKSKVRVGFHDCLTRLRLRSAVADLNHTDKSMVEVALDNGFPNAKSFYKSFRDMYQKTPFQYKKQIMSGDLTELRASSSEQQQSQQRISEMGISYPNEIVETKMHEYMSKMCLA
jgi:xylan 1,4-beta-xylosidase